VSPKLKILGIYRPAADAARCERFIAAQLASLDGLRPARLAEIERELRDYLGSVALVEVSVTDPDGRFSVDDFLQTDPSLPNNQSQAAWNEIFLSPDGEAVIGRKLPIEPRFRIAFYVHFWNDELGLESSYGRLPCPKPQPMPERLWGLAPYELPD
jgi:hypothetical protein